jgi:hypothetical protein
MTDSTQGTSPSSHMILPTVEESHRSSESWMTPLRPCLYTHWPQRFKELSFDTQVVVLASAETAELIKLFDGKDEPWSPRLQSKIKQGVSHFTSGCFFRLESRSPKDNYWGEMTNFRACSFYDVKKLLYSERMMDDLARYTFLESEPVRLLFREWHAIPKGREFRCFIRNRRLVGISQYHYAGFDERTYKTAKLAFAEVVGRAAEWEARLSTFITQEVLPHLHVPDLVVDLWVDHVGKVTLIEINPYGLSDPCLFSYPELEQANCGFRAVQVAA